MNSMLLLALYTFHFPLHFLIYHLSKQESKQQQHHRAHYSLCTSKPPFSFLPLYLFVQARHLLFFLLCIVHERMFLRVCL